MNCLLRERGSEREKGKQSERKKLQIGIEVMKLLNNCVCCLHYYYVYYNNLYESEIWKSRKIQ